MSKLNKHFRVIPMLLLIAFAMSVAVACDLVKGELAQIVPPNAIELKNRFYQEHKNQDSIPSSTPHVKSHETVFVPKNAQRVVVFGLGDLDSYLSLGLQERVVGRAIMSGTPKNLEDAYPIVSLQDFKAGKKGVVGVSGTGITDAPHDPNYSIIVELEPDLIIIESRQRSGRGSSGHYQRLSAIAPTLDFGISQQNAIKNTLDNLDDLSQIYPDKATLVQNFAQDILTSIQEVHQIATESNPKTLMLLRDGETYSIHGKGGRWSMVYNELGLSQSIKEISNQAHGTDLTPDLIAKNNSDIELILLVDRAGGSMSNSILNHEYFKDTPAIKNNLVVDLDTSWYFMAGGANNILTQIGEIKRALALFSTERLHND